MSQWKNTDDAANSVNYVARTIGAGSGKSNIAANNTALYGNTTVDAFISGTAVGQFAVSTAEMANTSGESKRVTHAGWQIRRAGEGPVLSFAVSNNGSNFANGETILVHGGAVNAVGTVVTNATGYMTSVTVTTAGRFSNTSQQSFAYRREKHMNNITVTGGSGYHNTDYIVASNGTTNAVATLTTNSSGGFANADIVLTNVGLWANTKANSHVAFAVYAANGAVSNGADATLVANLSTSSDGTVTTTLGGRAGRVHYETIVAMGSISNGDSDDTYFPET